MTNLTKDEQHIIDSVSNYMIEGQNRVIKEMMMIPNTNKEHRFCCTRTSACLHAHSIKSDHHAFCEFSNTSDIKYLKICPFCGMDADA